MKVILLQELHGRGGEGDVVDVAHGFAVNYLLPRKMAVEATSGNLKQLEQRKKNIATREETRVGDSESLAANLEGKKVTVVALVGEEGQLFGSVTTAMIRDALAEQFDITVDHRRIETKGAIKTAGDHEVMLSIYREIKANFTVHVTGDADETVAVGEASAAEAEAVDDVAAVATEAEDAAATVAADEVSADGAEDVSASESADDFTAAEEAVKDTPADTNLHDESASGEVAPTE